MGDFIKNKSKRVSETKTDYGLLKNNSESPILIGEENAVPGKKSIKGTIKENVVVEKPKVEIVQSIQQQKPQPVAQPIVQEIKKPIEVRDRFTNLDLALMDMDDFKDFIKDKTIILVANSSDLLTKENGWFIDNHDIIVRFNSFLIEEKYTGIETTIHCVFQIMESCFEYYVPIRFVLSTTEDLSKLGRYNQSYVLKYDHRSYDGVFTDEEKKIVPTSGFKILRLLLKLGGFYKINLIGFTFYEGGESSVFRSTEGISKVHNYDYERDYIIKNCYNYDEINNIITFFNSKK